ncbi:DUF4145 domain-containing protein, partial [Gemmata sp. JC673]|nr:DUF4145 domain-containing protein [Gemmata algarum]
MNVVSGDGAKILHSLRFMGNNAAHEVKGHTAEELTIALGVVEYLLHGVYVMPKKAAKLPQKPPQAQQPAKPQPKPQQPKKPGQPPAALPLAAKAPLALPAASAAQTTTKPIKQST